MQLANVCERVGRVQGRGGRYVVVTVGLLCLLLLLPPLLLSLSRHFTHSYLHHYSSSHGGLHVYEMHLNAAQKSQGANHTRPILQRLARYYSDDDKQYWYDDNYDLDLTRAMGDTASSNTGVLSRARRGTTEYRKTLLQNDVITGSSSTVPVKLMARQAHTSVAADNKVFSASDNSAVDSQRGRHELLPVPPPHHHPAAPCQLQAVSKDIFWSSEAEKAVPKGITANDVTKFRQLTSVSSMRLEAGTWRRCGRPRNALVHLSDGSKACARHRHPDTRFMLGEVLSFYLARLLAMDNVAPVIVLQVNFSDVRWNTDHLRHVNWSSGDYVSLSKWIDGLDRADVTMPHSLLASYTSGVPLSFHNLSYAHNSGNTGNSHPLVASTRLTCKELADLQQWSNMILFDYLTGNYDRVASMQDGAEQEVKARVQRHNIRNVYGQSTGKLWLVDNESGLLDAYDLLYRSSSARHFTHYHMQMLRSICIFSEATVTRLRRLSNQVRPVQVLIDFAQSSEPFLRRFNAFINKQLFVVHFDKRLNELLSWIRQCQLNFVQTGAN